MGRATSSGEFDSFLFDLILLTATAASAFELTIIPVGVSAAAPKIIPPMACAACVIFPLIKLRTSIGVNSTENARRRFNKIAVKKSTSYSGLLISESAKLHKSAARQLHKTFHKQTSIRLVKSPLVALAIDGSVNAAIKIGAKI